MWSHRIKPNLLLDRALLSWQAWVQVPKSKVLQNNTQIGNAWICTMNKARLTRESYALEICKYLFLIGIIACVVY